MFMSAYLCQVVDEDMTLSQIRGVGSRLTYSLPENA
jgi:hypothetical protein